MLALILLLSVVAIDCSMPDPELDREEFSAFASCMHAYCIVTSSWLVKKRLNAKKSNMERFVKPICFHLFSTSLPALDSLA